MLCKTTKYVAFHKLVNPHSRSYWPLQLCIFCLAATDLQFEIEICFSATVNSCWFFVFLLWPWPSNLT